MKGDQRNAALKVMLVSCPCHQNGPVIFTNEPTLLSPQGLLVLYFEQRCMHDLSAVSILFLL